MEHIFNVHKPEDGVTHPPSLFWTTNTDDAFLVVKIVMIENAFMLASSESAGQPVGSAVLGSFRVNLR